MLEYVSKILTNIESSLTCWSVAQVAQSVKNLVGLSLKKKDILLVSMPVFCLNSRCHVSNHFVCECTNKNEKN